MKKIISNKLNSVFLNKSRNDEPIFVLCARDRTSPSVIRNWVSKNLEIQDDFKIQSALEIARQMEVWYQENIIKS